MLTDGIFDINLPQPSTSGNLLTSDGDNWISQAPAPAGSRTLISNTDVTGASTISRTADFSTSYSQYEIELRQFHTQGQSGTYTFGQMHLLDDQGTILSGNYSNKSFHREWPQGSLTGTNHSNNFIYIGLDRNDSASISDNNGSYYNWSSTLHDPCKAIVESGDTINSTTHWMWGSTQFIGYLNGDVRWYKSVFSNSGQTRKITGIRISLNDGSFSSGKLLIWGVGS